MNENSKKQTAKNRVDTNTIPNNCIWYESANGEIVEPHRNYAFDANIVSNTYANGKGIIAFDNDITTIGMPAFDGCKSLTSIIIPDSVTKISKFAFSGCTNLTSVTIPDSVIRIGHSAFCGCTSLTSVTIPNSVTEIGDGAFSGCANLTSFYGKFSSEDNRCLVVRGRLNSFAPNGLTEYIIPDSVTKIGRLAFYGCTGLTSVTIPDSVTEIGLAAFSGCTGLTSITIPDSVTSIGDGAFNGCTGLTSVTIPNSVTEIDESVFSGCTGLTRIYGKFSSEDNRYLVVDGVLNSFAPNGLTEYIIPDSVTSIGYHAFSGCTGLTSVTIPDSVTEIGGHAFSGCTNLTGFYGKFVSEDNRCLVVDGELNSFAPNGLTEYIIPDSVTSIGYHAFYDCTGLTSVTIPDSVTEIGGHAFEGCTGLKSVTISDSVTSIGWSAFDGCTALTSIYCKPTTPPILRLFKGFINTASNAKIYVPRASVSAYKTANGWKDYASRIEGCDF